MPGWSYLTDEQTKALVGKTKNVPHATEIGKWHELQVTIQGDEISVAIDGQAVSGPDPRRILVFQERGVFPWLTVEGNIGFGLSALSRAERDQRIAHYVQMVRLQGFEHTYPADLSGGMKQRLQVARTLVTHPRLVFMDEPTGGLDVSVQARLLDLIRSLVTRLSIAVVLVTHDIAVARLLAHRIAVMQRGRIVETGLTDQVLDDPQHPYTQLLVSSVLQA